MPFQKRKLLLAASAVIVALGVISVYYLINLQNQKENSGASATHALREAPRFELSDAKGQMHRLEEFKGQVVLLHFWASWCPPCLTELPQILALAHDYRGKPLKVVAISLDEKWADAQKVLNDTAAADIVSLIDPKNSVSDQYGSYQFPETYLINPKQQIVTKWIGGQDWKDPNLRKLLDAMISKTP